MAPVVLKTAKGKWSIETEWAKKNAAVSAFETSRNRAKFVPANLTQYDLRYMQVPH